MGDPLSIVCDRAELARAIVRLWPSCAAVAGVDAAHLVNVYADREGWLTATGLGAMRSTPTVRALACEELANGLEDAGYAIEREGASRRVLGLAAYDALASWGPGSPYDLRPIRELDIADPRRIAHEQAITEARLERRAPVDMDAKRGHGAAQARAARGAQR